MRVRRSWRQTAVCYLTLFAHLNWAFCCGWWSLCPLMNDHPVHHDSSILGLSHSVQHAFLAQMHHDGGHRKKRDSHVATSAIRWAIRDPCP